METQTFSPCTNIFERIKRYDLAPGEYAVFGSSLMDVMGIRPAKDLDIIATPKLFSELEKRGWQRIQANGFEIMRNDEADVTTAQDKPTDGSYNPDRLAMIRNSILINGCPFVRIEEVIACKTAYNRPKDLVDIASIKRFLQKHPSIFD